MIDCFLPTCFALSIHSCLFLCLFLDLSNMIVINVKAVWEILSATMMKHIHITRNGIPKSSKSMRATFMGSSFSMGCKGFLTEKRTSIN